jgi:4-hydroxyacetophenone monooxygenase
LREDGNGWYDMLSRDNVELVTDPIETFNESGIATKAGKDREHDVIILANGFKVSSYFFPTEYVGRNGTTPAKLWDKDGARSYLGIHLPDMPNFFSMYGPASQPRGGAYHSWAEIWARFIAKSLVYMLENDKKSMAVKQEVYDEYQEATDREMKKMIWESPGAAYYVNAQGRQDVNMPFGTKKLWAPWTRLIF